MKQIQQLLKEGAMDEEKVYDSTEKLVNLCRECNVTLRWLILHSIPRYAGKLIKLIPFSFFFLSGINYSGSYPGDFSV